MDREVALKVNGLIEQMIGIANEVLFIVNNSSDDGNKKKIQIALGTAIAEIDLEILEPIYKQFPDLRPPEMEEIQGNSP